MKFLVPGLVSSSLYVLLACSSSNNFQEKTSFTHLDSLTDTYLVLQDSVLQSWNRVLKVESEKSKTLQGLLSELSHDRDVDPFVLASLNDQLNQLERIRFTPKTLGNPHVVTEYDRACSLIVQQLHGLSNAKMSDASKKFEGALSWFGEIQVTSLTHRAYYDSLAHVFNQFIETHRAELNEIERNHLDNKPLFKVDSAER